MSNVLKDLAQDECELEMTPMIDVTFLLLIFFMCTIKFKTLEGKLSANLPKDVGVNTSDAPPKEKVEITISVVNVGTKMNSKKDGPWKGGKVRFAYGDDRLVRYQVGPKKTSRLSELEQRLKTLRKADPERPATINARKGVDYEEVVQVLDLCLNADYDEITFVGSFE